MCKNEFQIENKFYIAGAHSRARTLAAYIQYLADDYSIEAYLVTDDEDNPDEINNVPVIRWNMDIKLNPDYPAFIGTRGVYHRQIEDALRKSGIEKIYPVTVELDMKLRNAYLKKYFSSIHRGFPKIDDEATLGMTVDDSRTNLSVSRWKVCVYVAKSIFDKPLKQQLRLERYERVIYVGAALSNGCTENGVITDATGDNISIQNKQFCELTGLYWIWKNALEDIVGLVHYRRHFLLPGDWLDRMERYGIDVILPVPLYVAPSIEKNYMERHYSENWFCMMDYLQHYNVGEYQQIKEIFQGNLYSPCNMFIMRRNVLDELCEWLFPILNVVAAQGETYKDAYQNRYPGFLSERLITAFFEIRRGQYKVVYSDKNFYEGI